MPVRAKNRGGVRGRFFVLISEKMNFGLGIKGLQDGMRFYAPLNLNYLKSQLSQISITKNGKPEKHV